MIEVVKVAEQSLPPPNIVIFICHRFLGVAKDADDHMKENFEDKCWEKNIASEQGEQDTRGRRDSRSSV